MRCFVLLGSALLVFSGRTEAADPIALIKGLHIFITDSDGKNPRQIDNDPRGKSILRWDRGRQRLGYLADRLDNELSRLTIIDLNGGTIADVSVRPATDPPTSGMRFVENFDWLADGKARISGSINPSNCEMFDFDVNTGKESNDQFGRCGHFAASPDGKHVAELGLINQFTDEEHRFDSVDIDGRGFTDFQEYAGGNYEIFIVAGPVWSPDSQLVAVLEKRAASGEAAVVIVTLDRAATRVSVAVAILDQPSIEWIGKNIIAGGGAATVQIDSINASPASVTSNNSDEISHSARINRDHEAARRYIDAVVKKLGGREGILLDHDGTGRL